MIPVIALLMIVYAAIYVILNRSSRSVWHKRFNDSLDGFVKWRSSLTTAEQAVLAYSTFAAAWWMPLLMRFGIEMISKVSSLLGLSHWRSTNNNKVSMNHGNGDRALRNQQLAKRIVMESVSHKSHIDPESNQFPDKFEPSKSVPPQSGPESMPPKPSPSHLWQGTAPHSSRAKGATRPSEPSSPANTNIPFETSVPKPAIGTDGNSVQTDKSLESLLRDAEQALISVEEHSKRKRQNQDSA
jgi:hypothetical protein